MTIDEALELVGEKKKLLKELAEWMHENYKIDDEFKFYKKHGWTLFWRKSGKSLAIVGIKDNDFEVTVVIGASLEEKIKEAGVSQKTLKMFSEAKQYFDGRWLNYKNIKESDIEDVKKLIVIKKLPR